MKLEDLNWRIQDRPGETFKVHRSLYTSKELFELENKYIYEKNWIYLAHEEQIRNPNDYLSLFMGRQPVILTRDPQGKLHGFINACSHRGANICRRHKGNAKTFSCPYHGWVYNNQGELLDVKAKAQGGYTAEWGERNYNLVQVPKVESYKGFIFGSLNADVVDLETHLGPAKTFLDLQVELAEGEIEILRGTSTYAHHANWKMQAENGVDGYHADVVHASYWQLGADRANKEAAKSGSDDVKTISLRNDFKSGNYDHGNGHVTIWGDIGNPKDRSTGFNYDALVERVGQVKADWMASKVVQTMFYPNLLVLAGISTQIRTWRPIAPNLTEVTVVCFGAKNEPAEARERRIRQYEDFYGASGIATPDDLAEFDACQSGYMGALAEWQDFDRGMNRRHIGPDQAAAEIGLNPEVSAADVADETLYHGEYRQWLKLISAGLKEEEA